MLKRRLRYRSWLLMTLAAAAFWPVSVFAGGAMGPQDERNEDDGPGYFGFVKDARGVPVKDAKVSAAVKNGITLITHTDQLGFYKVGHFSKKISPNDVTITCAKEGYKQTKIFRRTRPGGKSIETECRLERG